MSLLPYDEDSVDPPSFRFVAGSAAPGGGVRLAEGVCVAAGDTVAAAANDEGVGQLQSSLGRLAAAKVKSALLRPRLLFSMRFVTASSF